MNLATWFGHWETVRRDLLRALAMLSDEQLQFTPREGLWSLGQVACHIARTEENWLRYRLRGTREGRPEYRLEDYPTVEAITALLAEVHERTLRQLEGWQLDDLQQTYEMPAGERLALGWILWHVLEHEIHHRGEIYLMLGLMGMSAPDI